MMVKDESTQKLFHSSYIVGMGASAGGLDAINVFFENMPAKPGLAFVIIQHISADHKSLMAELVAKHTSMQVVESKEGMLVRPNHIYLIPSGKVMTIKFGKLHLVEKTKTLPINVIDTFLDSLATDAGEMAIGVILSGTGTDGTKGVEAIKNKGGMVAVQDPSTAAFDGMPNSAIATNVADVISSPESMGVEIIDLINDTNEVRSFHRGRLKDELLLQDLLSIIRDSTGMDFTYYKRPTISRRLAKRMSELGMLNLKDYLDYIGTHEDEVQVISKEFLINVSSFFRDKEAFELIRTKIIPAILKDKKPEDAVKLWSVGCSTGEEAYSMAILFREHMERTKTYYNIKIFATDIDRDALEVAGRGIYPLSILQNMSGDRLAKYFIPEGNAYRIHPEIRKMVVFSYHDILKDPPFSRIDLVSCRNMVIYINPPQQKEILRKINFALNVDGFLFMGPSESIGVMKNVTQEVDRKWKIYKCIAKTRFDGFQSVFMPLERKLSAISQTKEKNPLNHLSELFSETLFDSKRFAGLFITKEMEVKQAIGNFKRFIDFPDSGFNFNLVKMVDTDLSMALSVAVNKSIRDDVISYAKGIQVRKGDSTILVNIIVKPFLTPKDFQLPFLFVIIEEDDKKDAVRNFIPSGENNSERVNELEQELAETRSNMQLLLEEVETSNEELRSINEEMISTNEELQSTNEELQSLNEELHTVSSEHQLKIKELIELNDDLNNYFNHSDIGQILIDKNLIIRKFTPSVSRMINLIDSDINRSIADITTKFKNIDLVSDIRSVLNRGISLEREILLNDNTIYLMRIHQYIRGDNTVDGVVVNFVDVSELRKLNSIVQAIFDSSMNGINAKRAVRNQKNQIVDFEYIAANKACEELYGVPSGTLVGKTMKSHDNFRREYFDLYVKVVETGKPLHYEIFEDTLNKWLDISVAKMMDGVVSTVTDITEKKKAADLIRQSYEHLKITSGKLADTNNQLEQSNLDLMQFASVASHDLKEPLRKIETFGNLLSAKLKERFHDGELKYLDKIISSSNRMQSLIEDVLTFSKLSNNELPFEKIDLFKILNRIKEDLEITIQEKKAVINILELPSIYAVKGQMHQLFQNLISNALKFNDKVRPSVTISERKVTKEMEKTCKIKAADYICISVKDNGIGFDEKFRDKIFGIFQRLHGSAYDGTGIGLAICKKIAENHNGLLIAESKPGKGSEFMVILPLKNKLDQTTRSSSRIPAGMA